MSTPWMDIALREAGVREGAKGRARIMEYQTGILPRRLLSDKVAWCACFVGWCLDQSEVARGTGKANARSYLKWGTEVAKARYGDVVVFSRPPIAWQGHVGFYHHENDTHIFVWGGNQNNSVCLKAYPKKRLIGVRRPS